MKKIQLLIFCLISISVFSQTPLSQKEITNLKQEVRNRANKTTSIISDFVQKKHMSFLSNDIKTYGKLIFKSPSSVKWEYTKPYQYSVVFKGNKLKINDGGKRSNVDLAGSKLFKNMNTLIVKSISGDMFDDKMFSIKYLKTKKNYLAYFTTKDKNLKKIIAKFALYFDKRTKKVNIVKMIEPSGDYTEITFKNRRENRKINDKVFSN